VNTVSVMGVGFVGGAYCRLYPNETHPEPRDALKPRYDDVIFTRSTVSNYNVLKPETLKLDVETNLSHLLDVLPNVKGSFSFVSSWFVFGRGVGQTYCYSAHEDDRCSPTGLYSITKRAAEEVVQSYCATVAAGLVQGPSSYRILRLCNVIGNDPRAGKQKNALEYMLKRVANGEDVNVYEGDNYRNFLHIDDVCRGIRLCATEGKPNTIYNIGAPQSVRMIDLIEHAKWKVGSDSIINVVPAPAFHKIVQTQDFWLDTARISGLGFVPEMDAFQAVDRVLANL